MRISATHFIIQSYIGLQHFHRGKTSSHWSCKESPWAEIKGGVLQNPEEHTIFQACNTASIAFNTKKVLRTEQGAGQFWYPQSTRPVLLGEYCQPGQEGQTKDRGPKDGEFCPGHENRMWDLEMLASQPSRGDKVTFGSFCAVNLAQMIVCYVHSRCWRYFSGHNKQNNSSAFREFSSEPRQTQ